MPKSLQQLQDEYPDENSLKNLLAINVDMFDMVDSISAEEDVPADEGQNDVGMSDKAGTLEPNLQISDGEESASGSTPNSPH